MHILGRTAGPGYEVRCEQCHKSFDSGRVGLAIECPTCGGSAMAADLLSEWTLTAFHPARAMAGTR